jgi:hypothetical protein
VSQSGTLFGNTEHILATPALHDFCGSRRVPATVAVVNVLSEDRSMAQKSHTVLRTPGRDLSLLREALTMIRSDLQRLPGLEGASAAITKALEEMVIAEHQRQPLPLAVRTWTRPRRSH